MAPNMHHSLFPICHLADSYMYKRKTIDCLRKFYISNNCSTIKCLSAWIRVACEVQLVSDSSKHTAQSLSDTLFVRIPPCIIIYMTCIRDACRVLHIEWPLQYWRHILGGFDSHERFNWDLQLQTHVVVILLDSIVCIYSNPVHSSLFGGQLRMMKKTHPPYECILHSQMMALLPMIYHIIWTNLVSYTICCSVLPIHHVH